MRTVDVIMTIGEKDELTDYDFRVMDALENMYPISRSVMRVGIAPRVEAALNRSKAQEGTHLGRRPLEVPGCLVIEGKHDHLVVALPVGSTWRAVNAGYMFLKDLIENTSISDLGSYETSSKIRHYAHSNIISLLDAAGEFSRYPFDVKIAYDLLFTLKLAMTRAQIGKGMPESIDSAYLEIPNHDNTVNLSKRETRQLALVFKYNPLPM